MRGTAYISRLAAVFSMACLMSLCADSARAADRYLLAVGHNLGLPGEDPLRFAERDAERFHSLMIELGQVDEQDARLLQAPSASQVLESLAALGKEVAARTDGGRGAVLTVLLAGHGDADHLHLAGERLARTTLLEDINAIPAGLRLVVLDSCQTTRTGRRRGVSSGPSFDIGVLEPRSASGTVVIRSTRAGEPAHESDTLGGAVFSHYLMSSLRGAGDLDRDGRITLMEAYGFAFNNTVRHSAGASSAVQHPSFDLELAGSGDLVLTWPVKATAILVLPAGEEIRHLVFQQPSGVVLVEAVSSKHRPLVLAVPPGRLLVQRREKDRFRVAEVNLPYGGRHELGIDEFSERPYETVARLGGELDLHPNSITLGFQSHSDRVSADWVLRNGLDLSYDHRLGRFHLGLRIGLAWTSDLYAYMETEELALELGGRIGWWAPVGSTRVEISVGPETQLVFQKRQRSDKERLEQAGIVAPAQTDKQALGVGAGTLLGWRVPLGKRVTLLLAARASVLAIRVSQTDGGTGWQAVPVLGGCLGLGYRF